jgi:hypothetical protein
VPGADLRGRHSAHPTTEIDAATNDGRALFLLPPFCAPALPSLRMLDASGGPIAARRLCDGQKARVGERGSFRSIEKSGLSNFRFQRWPKASPVRLCCCRSRRRCPYNECPRRLLINAGICDARLGSPIGDIQRCAEGVFSAPNSEVVASFDHLVGAAGCCARAAIGPPVRYPSRRLRAIPKDNLVGQIDEGAQARSHVAASRIIEAISGIRGRPLA